jgi:hypothetical protein
MACGPRPYQLADFYHLRLQFLQTGDKAGLEDVRRLLGAISTYAKEAGAATSQVEAHSTLFPERA